MSEKIHNTGNIYKYQSGSVLEYYHRIKDPNERILKFILTMRGGQPQQMTDILKVSMGDIREVLKHIKLTFKDIMVHEQDNSFILLTRK